MFYVSMIYKQTVWLYVSIALNGFANLSTNAVMFELGVEVTYQEVGEATSSGFVNVLINIFQFSFIMALTPILDNRSQQGVMWSMVIMLGLILASIIFTLIAPINYKRSKL